SDRGPLRPVQADAVEEVHERGVERRLTTAPDVLQLPPGRQRGTVRGELQDDLRADHVRHVARQLERPDERSNAGVRIARECPVLGTAVGNAVRPAQVHALAGTGWARDEEPAPAGDGEDAAGDAEQWGHGGSPALGGGEWTRPRDGSG